MATWAKAVFLLGQVTLTQSQIQCADPITVPTSVSADRSLFSFLASIDFSQYLYVRTQGYCRNGPSWNHEPALDTNMGHVESAPNNRDGDNLWFCLKEPRTEQGCLAECETRGSCEAIDRPTINEAKECCLFSGNNTGDGKADRECFSKMVKRDFEPGDLTKTYVSVMPLPFLSYLTLHSESTGVVATAEQGLCPMWTWCGFVIKDCRGKVLYDISVEHLPDVDWDGTLLAGTDVLSYVIHGADGKYLGRTSELTDGRRPIRILNAQNQQVSVLITAAGWIRRALFPLRWFVNNAATKQPASESPMGDPRLLTIMVTYQFRNLGYFGIFWVLLLLMIVIAILVYLRRSRLRVSSLYMFTNPWSAEEEEVFLGGGDDYSCCAGRGKNRAKENKGKETWGTSLMLMKEPQNDMI